MVDLTPFLPGLSPVQDKAVVARFDSGQLSSEGGLLALREIERRVGFADRVLEGPACAGSGLFTGWLRSSAFACLARGYTAPAISSVSISAGPRYDCDRAPGRGACAGGRPPRDLGREQ